MAAPALVVELPAAAPQRVFRAPLIDSDRARVELAGVQDQLDSDPAGGPGTSI
jgi:hypothetical protein